MLWPNAKARAENYSVSGTALWCLLVTREQQDDSLLVTCAMHKI